MKNTVLFLLFLIVISCDKEEQIPYQKFEGIAFGTSFHITFEGQEGLITEKAVDSIIHRVNKSLSTYIPNSDISKINRGDTAVVVDELFREVFEKSSVIYQETNGFFDPTIGTLVNAWGFGPGKQIIEMNQSTIDSLMEFVGFEKVKILNGKLIKKHPETFLDFNANAKGYGVDVIGKFLEGKGISNYLVEIGGEIRARGVNSRGMIWRVAIEKPNFDGTRSFQTIVTLNNESIATSGNYRKFKVDSLSGEKYAHTIDAKTGYPTKSNLLSASVIGEIDCADTDAYATSFMAMGYERTRDFLDKHHELKVFLIYSDADGSLKTFTTSNLVLDE
ncbi:FAD:protein FMN transferase [Lutimonas zeaxanthinifaciens]|uniref:FAD:protein FMN transferase n=1 Tax=Lutimonas zeaxanthinifaciens TaxID=3060215 RepID=UPI00265D1C45|nr:FAD:protein FMN transferase [Lutimonas sp. YSD2104]WKK65528.1 FAD:protein FMN transferase [Lutimonas sp. YSD2104]